MSLISSGKARWGPDLVGKTRGSVEWVKIVRQVPGVQEKAVEAMEAMLLDVRIRFYQEGPG